MAVSGVRRAPTAPVTLTQACGRNATIDDLQDTACSAMRVSDIDAVVPLYAAACAKAAYPECRSCCPRVQTDEA
jgi:hypothetical protein